ncbi:cytochrome P450 [Nocardia alni]|uniref:cytochrome P450 n=1 Tax=Nocardia alni TaxID=2815723 RepID=UPI001C217873|nr:cytochrome P450 [Nocardia alni]
MTSTQYPAAALYDSILDPANRHDPYPYYAELLAEPLHRLDEHVWLVTRYTDIVQLLRDPRMTQRDPRQPVADPAPLGSDGTPFHGPFLVMDPPHHDTLRRQTMHQFIPRILGLRPHIERLVHGLLDARGQGPGVIDIVTDLAYPLPVGVICELLGVPASEEPVFHAFAERLTRGLDPEESLSEQEKAELAVTRGEWRDYLTPMIARRHRDPGDDLISGLLTEGDAETRMNAVELGATLGMLLIAGHETTVNLVTNGVLTLLRNPGVLGRLRADPDLAPAVVEEVLRYDPPVQMTGRHTTAPIQVAGQTIPAGDDIRLLLAAGNRDPRRFTDPARFDPDRPDNAHLGFGGGVHYCLGAALARMEAQAALSAVAARVRAPRLLADPPAYRPNMVLRGPATLRLAYDEITA